MNSESRSQLTKNMNLQVRHFGFVGSLMTATALCSGCLGPVSVDDFVYRCDPAGNDCASGYECLKAGTEYVCGKQSDCTQTCSPDWACVNGECRCFESCDGRECGDDGCGGSCGKCDDREWCDSGTCKDDCAGLECGESPNLGVVCGTCQNPGEWCDSGKCVDDCAGLECGESPELGIDCGACLGSPAAWCDSGTCKDDCAGLECGESPNLGVACGTCSDLPSVWCDSGTCKDDCAGLECGESPGLGVVCGTCQNGWWCDQGICEDDCGPKECGLGTHDVVCGTCQYGWWCDSGTCRFDCAGLECGRSPLLKVDCGDCQNPREWCDAGQCLDDCGTKECGAGLHGGVCGTCQTGWWCNSGTCKNDCAGLECGESPNLRVACGTCQNAHEWCDSGTCKDDCAGLECGASPNLGVVCGTCQNNWWCDSGTCKGDCGPRNCGTDSEGNPCGTCQDKSWCDSGTCRDDCGIKECGTGPHGAVCGECGTGSMCSASGTCFAGTMISIPGGTFLMGSENGGSNEKPLHSVNVNSFELSQTEVTVRQYKICVDAGACSAPATDYGECTWNVSGKEDHPVNCVDWDQATEYASWAGGRLPTEAEWEYAARAGTTGDRYGATDDIAWHSGNSGGGTHLVGQLDPNAFGLYDMLGNVWEWCQDWYHNSYSGAPDDGSAWLIPSGASRVFRGGSWNRSADLVRVADREANAQSTIDIDIGFRIARSIP